jgi:hypothetical protein
VPTNAGNLLIQSEFDENIAHDDIFGTSALAPLT